jgi:hypothetical protein
MLQMSNPCKCIAKSPHAAIPRYWFDIVLLTPIYLPDYAGVLIDYAAQFTLTPEAQKTSLPKHRQRSVGLTVPQNALVPRSGFVQSGKSQPIGELVLYQNSQILTHHAGASYPELRLK